MGGKVDSSGHAVTSSAPSGAVLVTRGQGPQSPDRPCLLVIGAGEFQLPLVKEAAKSCRVLLAAPAVPRSFFPFVSEVLYADVRDYDAIAWFAGVSSVPVPEMLAGDSSAAFRTPVDGVITDGTDIPVLTVARIADALGLSGIGRESAQLFTNKALMRSKMEQLGIPVLPYALVCTLEEALAFYDELGGAVIVKPTDTQGSRGVQVCDTRRELEAKFAEAARWSTGGEVVVERFARGREFVVEGIAYDHAFAHLCIGDTSYFDLPDAFSARQRCFPTSAELALRQRVLDLDARIVEGFGLSQGITHGEYIMDGDDIYLIEIAARGGGAFISSDLIPLSSGVRTEPFLVDLALGRITSLADALRAQLGFSVESRDQLACSPRAHCAYVGFYLPVGEVLSVAGVGEVLSWPFVHGTQIAQLPDMVGAQVSDAHDDKTTRYLVTVSADSRDSLEERMGAVRATLKVEVRCPDGSVAGLIWE